MLFAEEVIDSSKVFQSVNFWLTIGLLMALLLGAAAVLSLTELWRKRQAKPTKGGIGGLSMYREMYDDGELDEEEYRAIRDRFAAELKGKPATPLPAPAKGAGVAGGANLDGPPTPPPGMPPTPPPEPPAEPPAQAPPIS